MDSHNAGIVFGGILIAVLVIFSLVWGNSRGTSILETWAREQGYEVLSQEECWIFRGPFFWSSSKGQKIYKVALRNREGQVRTGYARCGGYWLGLFSDAVEVRWDD